MAAHTEIFTAALVCTLPIEFKAALALLDHEYGGLKISSTIDEDSCRLGRIRNHNVVIAIVPKERDDLSLTPRSIRCALKDILFHFSTIRLGLLVGISSGALRPEHDIQLGDIVVGTCDFQRNSSTHTWQQSPSDELRRAIRKLRAEYDSNGQLHEKSINEIFKSHPMLEDEFQPPVLNDEELHQLELAISTGREVGSTADLGSTHSRLTFQTKGVKNFPAIHYGIVLAASHCSGSSSIHEMLAIGSDIFCIEAEAADFTENFPCLAIRSICDYADVYETKNWHGYAAITAAACARSLLSIVNLGSGSNYIPSDIATSRIDETKFQQVRKPRRFFRTGRVFATHWTEPRSGIQSKHTDSFSTSPPVSKSFSEVRLFIVVEESDHCALCVPIHTYMGRGLEKQGIKLQNHARVYRFGDELSAEQDTTLRKPIGIIIEESSDFQQLHPASVADFGRVYTIEHHVKVTNIGFVPRDHNHRLAIRWTTPIREVRRLLDKADRDHISLTETTPDEEKEDDTSVTSDDYGAALQAASSMGHREIVEMLLDYGADIDVQSGSHGTALYAACFKGHSETVELLLRRGADPDKPSGQNRTALQAAALNGHKRVVEILLENKARNDIPPRPAFSRSYEQTGQLSGRDKAESKHRILDHLTPESSPSYSLTPENSLDIGIRCQD